MVCANSEYSKQFVYLLIEVIWGILDMVLMRRPRPHGFISVRSGWIFDQTCWEARKSRLLSPRFFKIVIHSVGPEVYGICACTFF